MSQENSMTPQTTEEKIDNIIFEVEMWKLGQRVEQIEKERMRFEYELKEIGKLFRRRTSPINTPHQQ